MSHRLAIKLNPRTIINLSCLLLFWGCSGKGLDIHFQFYNSESVVAETERDSTDNGNDNSSTPLVDDQVPSVSILSGPSIESVDHTQSSSFTLQIADTGGSELADGFEIQASHIILNTASGDATCDTVVITNGMTANPIVTLSDCRGVGSVTIAIAAGSIADKAANLNIQSLISDELTIDAYCGNYLDADSYDENGNGSESAPHRICTAEQLVHLALNTAGWDKHFVQMLDIDLSDVGQNAVTPIGDNTTAFTGSFDGNGFTISHLDQNDNTRGYLGLFGKIDGNAKIKDVKLTDVSVVGLSNLGALVGRAEGNSFITGSSASGSVNGSGSVGGLVGYNNSVIVNSFADVVVTASSWDVGGFVGLSYGYITSCYALGDVQGLGSVGGFAGQIIDGLVGNSYSTGNVSDLGDGVVGGFAGYFDNSLIVNSYSLGNVEGQYDYVGGFVGYGYISEIINSFSLGNVDGHNNSYVGRFAGFDDACTIVNSYIYSGSTISNCAGNCDDLVVSSHANITDFYSQLNEPLVSWDFTTPITDGKTDDFWIANATSFPQLWFEEAEDYPIPFDGDGDTSSPYLISSVADFYLIGANPRWFEKSFQLTNDLDFSSSTFSPIGDFYKGGFFKGHFDGAGHELSNIDFQDITRNNVAIFSAIVGGSELENFSVSSSQFHGNENTASVAGIFKISIMSNIEIASDVTVEGASLITGGIIGDEDGPSQFTNLTNHGAVLGISYVGGIIGYQRGSDTVSDTLINTGDISSTQNVIGGLFGTSGGSIANSYSTGNVNGRGYVGGLVGNKVGQTISDSYTTIGNVTGNSSYVGGLVGRTGGNLVISDSYSTVAVSSSLGNSVGGLVGYSSSGVTIRDTYATGNVFESVPAKVNSLGGLIGYCINCNITRSYATGDVTGMYYVGGLLGFANNLFGSIQISDSYATGDVIALGMVGGFAGYVVGTSGTIATSYATGNVTINGAQPTYHSAGGFAGYNRAIIEECFSTGNVTSTSSAAAVGGLVGLNIDPTAIVRNSFATGNVIGNFHSVGGVVGQNAVSAQVSNVYATGNVTGSYTVGGIVGYNVQNTSVTNSFATGNVTGGNNVQISRTIGNNNNGATSSGNYAYSGSSLTGCTGSCNANVNGTHASISSFFDSANAPMSTWDFTNIWLEIDDNNDTTPDDYPFLVEFD